MMKHIFLLAFIAMIILPGIAHAQSAGEIRKQYPPERKNGIYLKTALLSAVSDDDPAFFPLAIEYDRKFAGKFSWVAGLSYSSARWDVRYYDYGCDQDSYHGCGRWWTDEYRMLGVNAKIAFTQPIIKRWLFFRAEGGLSGIWRSGNSDWWDEGDRFIPALVFEAHIMVRFRNGMEIMFTPFVANPSLLKIGLGNDPFVETNILPFAIGFRF